MRLSSCLLAGSIVVVLSCGGKAPPDNPFITTDQAAIGFDQIFGAGTLIGQAPQASLAINNEGLGDLHISAITYSGDGAFTMASQATPPITLKGMQSTFVQLVFTPTAEKMYTGNINIKSDAENTTSLDIPVSGLGLGANISVDHMTVAFDNTGANKTEMMTLAIQNPTATDLHISAIALTGDSAFTMMLTDTPPFTIGGNQSAHVALTFAPTAYMAYTGNVNIKSDAENTQSLDVPLTGTGVDGGM